MKRTVYKGFGPDAKRITVESTEYKDFDGKVVWVGSDGMTYELSRTRGHFGPIVWGATPMVSLEEGIEKGYYRKED